MRRVLILTAVLAPLPALAHGGSHDPASPWSLEAWVAAPLLASAALYTCGVIRLWRKLQPGRGVRGWQAVSFACGWILLAIALVSPMHELGERLFAAHMLEHEILMTVAAPLLVIARPVGGMLWALPPALRRSIGGISRHKGVARLWRVLIDPLVATVLHGAAVWIWHIPVLFNAALANPAIHGLQHVSFFGTALLFWWSLLRGRARVRGYGVAALYLFLTALHSGFLGILLSIARAPIYPGQSAAAPQWGLMPLEDQQLAGLIMWVPAGVVYAAATLVMLGIWIRQSSIPSLSGGGHAPLPR
ncbi:cytochrome c oxidase assembly protein [Microvirga rosea]|uniref:cytochrome c oxidase assembly protein n=1 Tax=Microvirga rosea TaxID=2715425 RepID=UPI001D09A667|nr:cytochrome c oxidase assembly protein [Microvirga rosea]MCB8821796.1 cytochrome c oxidase assembly protein [Microvirga rosea]